MHMAAASRDGKRHLSAVRIVALCWSLAVSETEIASFSTFEYGQMRTLYLNCLYITARIIPLR